MNYIGTFDKNEVYGELVAEGQSLEDCLCGYLEDCGYQIPDWLPIDWHDLGLLLTNDGYTIVRRDGRVELYAPVE